MSTDRLAAGYQPNFDIDAQVGRQGELMVADVIAGLRDGSVEVKTDQKAAQTGNVYIEWSCRRRNDWHPSGIHPEATASEMWAIVLGPVVVVAPTAVMLRAARTAWAQGLRRDCMRGSHPTRGVLIPIDSLIRRCMNAAGESTKAA